MVKFWYLSLEGFGDKNFLLRFFLPFSYCTHSLTAWRGHSPVPGHHSSTKLNSCFALGISLSYSYRHAGNIQVWHPLMTSTTLTRRILAWSYHKGQGSRGLVSLEGHHQQVNAIHPAGCDATCAWHVMGILVFVDRKGFSSALPELSCPPPCCRTTTEEKPAGSHQKWAQTMSIVVRALRKFLYQFLLFSTDE
jgi:hypothetical protein